MNSHLRDEEPSSPNCPQHPPHTYSKEKSTVEYRFKHIIQSNPFPDHSNMFQPKKLPDTNYNLSIKTVPLCTEQFNDAHSH